MKSSRLDGGCSMMDPWHPLDTSAGTGAADENDAPPSVESAAKRQWCPPQRAISSGVSADMRMFNSTWRVVRASYKRQGV